MNELSATDWQRESEEARALLRRRFPDLVCLRCGKDRFSMRLWQDPTLVPALADVSNNRVIELICDNCGFQEKHVVRYLKEPDASDGEAT